FHGTGRGAKVTVRILHPDDREPSHSVTEHAAQRPGLGALVRGRPVPVHADEIGLGARILHRTFDDVREAIDVWTLVRVSHETAVPGAGGVSEDLAMDHGPSCAGALERLEHED